MMQRLDDLTWRSAAVDEVLDRRTAVFSDRRTTTRSLDEVGGHVLAEEIVATTDRPAFDRATMDGYAFDATEEYPLTLADTAVYPEDEPPSIGPGEAVEISTGAPLPPEANAVLKREQATVTDGQLRGPPLEPGTYTYRQGSNVAAGEQLFDAGERLAPKDAILLGDLGRERVTVFDPLSVAVIATGSEIHEGRTRDLDSDMLMGLIRAWGHTPTYEGTVPDEYERIESRLTDLADAYDVVVTTGGTSLGKKDYVVRALDALGEVRFHGVRIRPGKPIAMAALPDATAFAIPGKPIGAHIVTTLVARSFFVGERTLPRVDATFTTGLELGADGFEYAVPVTLDDGAASPLGHSESQLTVYEDTFDPSVLSSSTRASRADGFVLTESPLEAGETVDVVTYESVN